jgi:hypothetical protein
MPTKRTPLQHFNPVKYQSIDLSTEDQTSPPTEHPSDADSIAADVVVGSEASLLADRMSGNENSPPRASDVAPTIMGGPVLSAPNADERGGSVMLRSPVSNRDRFMAGFLPARTCCNLDLVRAPAGSKFSLTGICIAVYPAATNPDRRYIQLADLTGTVGVTVWNSNVHKFSNASVGALVSLSKVSISSHHGKKQINLSRDSIVELPADSQHNVCQWWQELLTATPKTCGAVHDVPDNDIISVSGVCGHVTSEAKMVNGSEKRLTVMHLVDSCGRLDIRSWNHSEEVFRQYCDRPVIIRRVRVTSFAGTKLCEILDGCGSPIETEFPGKVALAKFWAM